MADGAIDDATLDAYASAQARLEHAGGYTWREIDQRDAARPRLPRRAPRPHAGTFSGGELTRASLARALAGDPDLLLLDEPTNHLDIAALEWLETHLQTLDAAVVLVAHDRWFLEAVGTSVLELEGGRAASSRAPGTRGARRRRRASSPSAARSRSRRPRSRGSSASSPASARAPARARRSARQKKLDKMDRVGRDPRDGKALGFAFKPPERSGRVVFEVEDGKLAIGDRVLLDDFELWLERGEHVSLVGPNGTGKTTLIHALAGERELDAGKLRSGHNVKLGLLTQHAEELGVDAGHRARGVPARDGAQAQRGALAARAVPVLRRGGREAARRALRRRAPAALAGDPRPVGRERPDPRRADQPPRPREPRGARGGAAGLPGRAAADLPRPRAARRGRHAHDRGRGRHAALLRRRLARVRARARGARRARAPGQAREAGAAAHAHGSRAAAEPGAGEEPARASAKQLEAEIEGAEAELRTLEDELADPSAWNDPRSAQKSTKRHAEAKKQLEALYERWEAVAG